MLKKEMKILVSFSSTTSAMAMEKFCKANNIEGRMIPLPKEISAGCGIAWISPIEIKETIKQTLIDNKLEFDKTYEMEI